MYECTADTRIGGLPTDQSLYSSDNLGNLNLDFDGDLLIAVVRLHIRIWSSVTASIP